MEIEVLTSCVQALEFTNEKECQAHQQAIEENDAALALLNDDLQNPEYEKVALQAQRDVFQVQLQRCRGIITHLRTRSVDNARDPDKGNILGLLRKTPPLKKISFMSIPIILRGYNDGLLAQKDDGLRHNVHIIDS